MGALSDQHRPATGVSQARVAVTSVKGGVGKTTVALNVSYALARRGWDVLLVDTDPQGGIGLSLRGDLRKRPGLAEALVGDVAVADAVHSTRLRNLDLMSAGTVPPFEAAAWSAGLEDGIGLDRVLSGLGRTYQVVVFDTAPGLSGSAVAALRNATHVLVPLQAEPLAARTVRPMLEAVGRLRDEGGTPDMLGIVLTMLQTRADTSLGVAQESWRLFPEGLVFEASVPRDPVFLEASAAGLPLALLSRRPPAVAAVFDQLAGEIEERLGWLEEDDEQGLGLLD